MGKINKYRLSDDRSYWIGTTNKGDDFWFDGDEDNIKYIKSCNWRKRTDGYFQNYEGKRLHRVVMKENNPNLVVDHIFNNKFDNRINSLRVTTYKENNKNKISTGKTGITGLCEINNRYFGNIVINGISCRTKTKDKENAYIDLLIVQKEYGFLHNEKDFILLNTVSEARINEVLSKITERMKNKDNNFIQSKIKNKYELSEDKTYWICFSNNEVDNINSFKISLEDKDKIDRWCWSIYKSKGGKYYVHANVENRKIALLHRYIMELDIGIYSKYFVDHVNSDGLDNRQNNLIITDTQGNNSNIISEKGYHKTKSNKFRATISCGEYNKIISKVCETEQEAREWYLNKKQEQLNNRKTFKNKNELDIYLKNIA